MAKMSKAVMALVNDPTASKALATCDQGGNLNVVPKGTFATVDEETIAFGDLFGSQTNVNLEATGKAALSVFKMDLPPVGYQIKGTFKGFETSGPMFDAFQKKIEEMLKMKLKAVGVFNVDEVYSSGVPKPGAKIS